MRGGGDSTLACYWQYSWDDRCVCALDRTTRLKPGRYAPCESMSLPVCCKLSPAASCTPCSAADTCGSSSLVPRQRFCSIFERSPPQIHRVLPVVDVGSARGASIMRGREEDCNGRRDAQTESRNTRVTEGLRFWCRTPRLLVTPSRQQEAREAFLSPPAWSLDRRQTPLKPEAGGGKEDRLALNILRTE